MRMLISVATVYPCAFFPKLIFKSGQGSLSIRKEGKRTVKSEAKKVKLHLMFGVIALFGDQMLKLIG
jgi:hypothetical protein